MVVEVALIVIILLVIFAEFLKEVKKTIVDINENQKSMECMNSDTGVKKIARMEGFTDLDSKKNMGNYEVRGDTVYKNIGGFANSDITPYPGLGYLGNNIKFSVYDNSEIPDNGMDEFGALDEMEKHRNLNESFVRHRQTTSVPFVPVMAYKPPNEDDVIRAKLLESSRNARLRDMTECYDLYSASGFSQAEIEKQCNIPPGMGTQSYINQMKMMLDI